jgi:uncharacterized membrane protein YkgB
LLYHYLLKEGNWQRSPIGVALGIFGAIVGTLIVLVGIGLLIQTIQVYDNAITIFQQQTAIQLAILSIVVFAVAIAIFYGVNRT